MALELIHAVGQRAYDAVESITTIVSPGYEEETIYLDNLREDEQKNFKIWADADDIRVQLNYGPNLCVISSGLRLLHLPESLITGLFSGKMMLGDIIDMPEPFNPPICKWQRAISSKPMIVGSFPGEYLRLHSLDFNWPQLSPITYHNRLAS